MPTFFGVNGLNYWLGCLRPHLLAYYLIVSFMGWKDLTMTVFRYKKNKKNLIWGSCHV